MASETLTPSGVVSSSNLVNDTNVLADDTAWATASSNNADSFVIVDFPTPSGNPTGLQNCTVKYRVTANANTVTFNVYILEGGTRLNGGAAVDSWTSTSTTEATREVSWNAALLGTADGSAMQLEVYATKSGGSPANRTAGEFQFVDWDAEVAGADALLADDVSSASTVSTPAMTELVTHALLADDVSSASTNSTPTATGVNGATATSVASASNVSVPTATGVNGATATSVSSASTLTTPTLAEAGTTDALLAEDVSSASTLSTPTATGVNGALAEDVSSASSVSVPASTTGHGLLAEDVSSVSSVSTPTATGVNSMTAANVVSISSVSNPSTAGAPYGKRINGQHSHNVPSNTSVTLYYTGSGYHSIVI